MSLSRASAEERKLKVWLRAKRNLKEKIERINWEEKEFYPVIEAYKAGKSVLGLPDGHTFDIVIEHENTAPIKTEADSDN